MAILNDESGAPIIRRTSERVPRRSLSTWLIGRPLATADAPHQTVGKAIGLAIFASDALSSTAYATQEIMVILAAAGTAAFGYAFPISVAITLLMVIVTLSYEQTIHAYPGGGGSYVVSRNNLGELPALIAAASLLTDYILTVAVSVSSGVDQLVSTIPTLLEYKVWIAVAVVLIIMLINLRGVRESGSIFAVLTYFFLITMGGTAVLGVVRYLTGGLGMVVDPPTMVETLGPIAAITPFLLLHAFSSGTSALTGIEAISNGVTAFREPRSRNAGITLLWMTGILATLFLSITFIAQAVGAVPSHEETIISQLVRTVHNGRGILYVLTMAATTIILFIAANTAFAGFPRLSALTAKDGYLPRQLTFRGSRLVYSWGIISLAMVAVLLIIAFQASVTRLIPLYAIGVFLSFTLSQAGMARRWWKSGHLKPGVKVQETGSVVEHDPRWPIKLVTNSLGAVVTFIVMLVFAFTKFLDGAWLVLIVIPLLVVGFLGIHRHYKSLASHLSLENYGAPPRMARHRVIIPVSGVHRGSLAGLRYARALSDDVTAVYISMDPEETVKLQEKWETWGEGVRLVILDSPYRLLVEPLLDYVGEVLQVRQPNEILTIVVPQFVPRRWYHNFLHTQTAMILRWTLLFKPGVVVTDVPYQVD